MAVADLGKNLLPDTSRANGFHELASCWSLGVSGLTIGMLGLVLGLLLGLLTERGVGPSGSPEVSCGIMPRISAAHCVDVGCSSKRSACLVKLWAHKTS